MARGIAAAHGVDVDVDYRMLYPVTVNDPAEAAFLAEDGRRRPLPRGRAPLSGSEDFSFVLDEVPGAFAMVGACPPGTNPTDRPPPTTHPRPSSTRTFWRRARSCSPHWPGPAYWRKVLAVSARSRSPSRSSPAARHAPAPSPARSRRSSSGSRPSSRRTGRGGPLPAALTGDEVGRDGGLDPYGEQRAATDVGQPVQDDDPAPPGRAEDHPGEHGELGTAEDREHRHRVRPPSAGPAPA